MNNFFDKDNKDKTNHNALIIGNRSMLIPKVSKLFLEEISPDVEFFKIDKFEISVDDIREIKDWIYESSSPSLKIVIISSFYFNLSVQNALLKVLEDTPKYARIILCAEDKKHFLKTILSRVFVYEEENGEMLELAKSFLKTDIPERLQLSAIKKLFLSKTENKNIYDFTQKEEIEDEEIDEDSDLEVLENPKNKRQDREKHIIFLDCVCKLIIQKWRNDREFFDLNYIKKIQQITKNSRQIGVKPTLYIEFIALTCKTF